MVEILSCATGVGEEVGVEDTHTDKTLWSRSPSSF